MTPQNRSLYIGNYYGMIRIEKENGNYSLCLDNHSSTECHPISRKLAKMLAKEVGWHKTDYSKYSGEDLELEKELSR